ncbi:hypothetical protein FB567DRAFT_628100 [Paraphoma chrysanthemicola]|uniref:Uncharacterized protein n=1 Tax=Paraphoma chrysanthemicola TaxID=798071 RepID=A0A8K0R8D0_9PLEO|nr:hypothetical protein FB567DRAFT_628100 [Paraphoma chrysanthemicola]
MVYTLRDAFDPNRCVQYDEQNKTAPFAVQCPTTSLPLIPATVPYTVTSEVTKCVKFDTNHVTASVFLCASPDAGPISISSTTLNATARQPPSGPVQTGPADAAPATGKNGLAGGAVAGIAIGMLLVGVLIAGIIFFFLLRRQRNRQYGSQPISHLPPPAAYRPSPEKGPVVVASAISSSIDNLLPQPASDDTITGEVSKIRDNIKNHVRTYCHSAGLTSGINEAALQNLAAASGVSSATLASSLANPSARQETLRLVFAWVILSKTTGNRNSQLLPFEIAELSGAITGASNNPKQTALYSKWKTITGQLLSGLDKNAQSSNQVHKFGRIIAELDSIVGPCVQGSIDDAQRRKNLDMILTRAANLAFLLFSQPGSFQFDFGAPRSGICAFPALLQTVGDQGQVISPPRLLFDGEIVAA